MDREALACDKKKARHIRAWIIFQDESGVSQRPSIRRTWAPKGETPVLIRAFNWKKLSVAAALAYVTAHVILTDFANSLVLHQRLILP